MDLEQKEERPQSEASSGSRGVPTTPPPTYLWEELRRSRSKGGYPWTILDKEPLPDNVDVELLLKGEIPKNWYDTEHLRSRSADKRTFKNRLRDRERSRRARSEPTHSVLSSSNASLSNGMDQAMAADPSNYESTDIDDFLLGDEDIPDFVMAYLQSDKGNLDEDIPSNILEYIQSRAAVLEKHQQQKLQHQQSDEIFYTENELRIIDEARKRLEERGELHLSSSDFKDVVEIDNFDHYFQIPAVNQGNSSNAEAVTVEPENAKEPRDSKKGQKFKFKNLSMPTKAQLAIKLPKMGRSKKAKKENEEQPDTELAEKKKRPHSLSPMRQKINQQFAIWNDSLKKFKVPGRRLQDPSQNVVRKSFVALLPGARSSSKPKIENQYEEIGAGRVELSNNPLVITVTEPDNLSTKKAECSAANENEGTEETMEGIENLPESEIVETHLGAVGSDAKEETIPPEDFVDIDIHSGEEHEDTEMNTQEADLPKSTTPELKGLAARGRKAFQNTKSKIQTSLSKEQLEATRKKLHATRKKVKSTLSKQNFQATRNKFQTTLNSTLKRKKGANPPDPLLLNPSENIFPEPFQGETRDYETSTPIKMKDERRNLDVNFSNEEFLYEAHPAAPTANKRLNKKKIASGDCAEELKSRPEIQNIEEEIEEYLEEEIEPKLEFFLHGTQPVRPPSISRSTETLPEESDKENVVIRPKRQRYRNRRQGFYEQIEEPLNDQNNTIESNDNWKYSKKPEKPTRTRSKKSLTSLTSDHIYSNVPPMRKKRGQPKNLSQQWSTSTWPRQDAIIENFHQPVVPKRLKSKSTKIAINYNLGSDNQTWPRRSVIKSPPSAPQRKRAVGSKKITNCPTEDHEAQGSSCMELDQNKSIANILVDADVLFGAESRFIDEDSTDKKTNPYPTYITGTQEDSCMELRKVQPLNNILAEADTLFGAESRFIDEEVLNPLDDRIISSNTILRENFSSNSTSINSGEFSNESKIINRINPASAPSVPSRQRKCSGSLRKQKSLKNFGKDDATWPRMSKHQPSAPRRRQKFGNKDKNISNIKINEPCAQLERSSKELPLTPVVPSSTPSDPIPVSAGADSIQAGLDHILEILATLPQETSNNIGITSQEIGDDGSTPQEAKPSEEEAVSTENPYAEIKQFQKKKPPRPPPPIYDASSTSSYSYIYTVPRRKKRITQTVSPERPPRNYCTIRPHRPPRKHRSFRSPTSNQIRHDSQHEESNRRHSFSGASNAQDENITQTQKSLLDSEAAPCWMLSRPLPAPPRVKRSRSPPQKPPRSRTSSLQRRKSIKNEETEIKEECSQVLAPQTEKVFIPNEYEPIENPVKVEETSVGIQTDPPLDDDESNIINLDVIDEDGYELKDGSVVDGHLQIASVDEPSQEAYESSVLEGSSSEPNTNTEQSTQTTINTDSQPPDNSENQHTVEERTRKSKEEDKIEQKQETKCKKCEQAENSESMSSIPINFQRPIPQSHRPIRIDFPTRLQLLELDVERLTVREVIADRLTVSQVETNTLDTNTLEVSQMTNASGQLIFNVGSNAVTIPSTVMSLSESEAKDEVIENVRTETTPVRVDTTVDATREEGRSAEPQIVPAVAQETKAESKKETFECSSQTTFENRERVERAPPTITTVPPPSVSDLTAQLVGLSSQNLARFGCAAATETWEVAKRVARLGLEQVNKQLQRQGVYFDDTEKENAKAILMVLLILVAAIFLLGMGRVPHRLSNHWEFYFTN